MDALAVVRGLDLIGKDGNIEFCRSLHIVCVVFCGTYCLVLCKSFCTSEENLHAFIKNPVVKQLSQQYQKLQQELTHLTVEDTVKTSIIEVGRCLVMELLSFKMGTNYPPAMVASKESIEVFSSRIVTRHSPNKFWGLWTSRRAKENVGPRSHMF